MSEVKFRAWQPHHSLHREPGMYTVADLVFYGSNEDGGGEAFFFVGDELATSTSSEYFKDIKLMQYTCLKDKNGKDIYANCDILETDGHRDTIELGWSVNDEYGFIWSSSKNIVIKQDFIDERYEIIGNIYENPELLETKS